MTHQIKSRKTGGTFTFRMNSLGGYVWLCSHCHQDSLPSYQIAEGGQFRGASVMATPQDFKATCQAWYRAYIRSLG